MTITGTISAAGSTLALTLRPNETVTVQLVSAAFVGAATIQRSKNGGSTWATAVNQVGLALAFTTFSSYDQTHTIRNETAKTVLVRVQASLVTSGTIDYTLTEVAGDVLEILVSSNNGPALIRTDRGVEIPGFYSPTIPGLQVDTALGLLIASGTISAADIIGTSAGQFGHASGYPLVADPGASYALELVSAVVEFDRAVAAYTGGGNITINANGGAALTGLISAANSLGNAADKVGIFRPLAAATEVVAPNKGFNLVSSGAFTDPGTAVGVIRYKVTYRLHLLALT